jgi:hypothetical protein
MNRIKFIILLAIFLSACESISVPKGQIAVKNDSQDKNYNIVNVVGGGRAASLRPGEHIILPKGTTTITLTRQYKDYTRSYTISCPPIEGSGIIIKMLDAHLNRLAGNCQTIQASK